jgi:hypothetical protein
MKRSEFILITETGKIPEGLNSSEIEKLVLEYPYCAGFRVAHAIAKKEEDALDTKSSINIAALYTQDRSKLYDYIIKSSLEQKVTELSNETHAFSEPEITLPRETQKPEEPDQEVQDHARLIPSAPLEEEIMSAALQSLGEIEIERFVEDQPKTTEIKEELETLEEDSAEGLSFGSWLLRKSGKEEKAPSAKPDRALIDKFIQEDPKISPVRAAFFSPSQMGKLSLLEDESFVSETLAKIYEKQGDFARAARAYKNLGLKNPEKRTYFAALQKRAEERIKK